MEPEVTHVTSDTVKFNIPWYANDGGFQLALWPDSTDSNPDFKHLAGFQESDTSPINNPSFMGLIPSTRYRVRIRNQSGLVLYNDVLFQTRPSASQLGIREVSPTLELLEKVKSSVKNCSPIRQLPSPDETWLPLATVPDCTNPQWYFYHRWTGPGGSVRDGHVYMVSRTDVSMSSQRRFTLPSGNHQSSLRVFWIGGALVSSSHNGPSVAWDIASGDLIHSVDIPPEFTVYLRSDDQCTLLVDRGITGFSLVDPEALKVITNWFTGSYFHVKAMEWGDDFQRNFVWTAQYETELLGWDLRAPSSHGPMSVLFNHNRTLNRKIERQCNMLVSADVNEVYVWDVRAPRDLMPLACLKVDSHGAGETFRGLSTFAFGEEGQLFTSGWDGRVLEWDLKSLECKSGWRQNSDDRRVNVLSLAYANELLISGAYPDCPARVWSTRWQKCVAQLEGSNGGVLTVDPFSDQVFMTGMDYHAKKSVDIYKLSSFEH